ncbi:helix-turn-helix domain-containing protein [Candidatus Woesebacteria bacterium]|nr:helix-turn-helix domain-containing protein [Candidatus Woesebacteria bacterium]
MNTLVKLLLSIKSESQAHDVLVSLFSPEEIQIFEKRISIVQHLIQGKPHRQISEELGVGIATVTRAHKELKLNHFKFLTKNS